MDKTLIGLLGAASALALVGGLQAPAAASSVDQAGAALQPAHSFAELLDPIPNAESILRAEDERSGGADVADETPMAMAQYYHHHHHYHHHYYHHHHHYYNHHHHHHHHHYHYY